MTNRKTMTVVCCLLGLAVLIAFAVFYQKKEKQAEPISATAFKLNTIVTVTIYDSKNQKLADEAVALCDKYEKLFSRTMESSELYQLNHGTLPKEGNAFVLSEETAKLIQKGLEYGKVSDGAFDIAIEPVSSLWDFTSGKKDIPSQEDISKALPLVNYKDVQLDGYAADLCQRRHGTGFGRHCQGLYCRPHQRLSSGTGRKSATINLGGNVLCVGEKPEGTPFKIGIQKPFADRSETIAVMNISDKSVVSSGIYERYFEKDGKIYHHILNPATGYPYDNHLVSVTIISDKSVDGDGLSTSCFALGLDKGMELINSLPDVQAVFITDDYELHYSDGFEEEISMADVK